jgi:hypothetical protein
VDRRDFGTWGITLSTSEFARAFAAVGVLAARAPNAKAVGVGELVARAHSRREPTKWRAPRAKHLREFDAAALAAVWFELRYSDATRLEVRLDRETETNVPWVLRMLGHEAVGAAAYVRWETSDPHRAWHWPLRVGIPSEAAALRGVLESSHWNRNVFDVVDVAAIGSPVDLLLLPWSARAAVSYLLAQPRPIRASCAILLDGIGSTWGRSRALLSALQTETRAAAIGAIALPPGDAPDWWRALIETLAHNQTLDVAIHVASRQARLAFPLLLASRAFIAATSLEVVARQMGERLERSAATDTVELGPTAAPTLRVPRGTPRDIGRVLRRRAHALPYDGETHGATVVAELARDGVRAAADAGPREPEHRRVQVRAYDLTHGRESQVQRLQPETSYGLDVRITVPEADATVAPIAFASEGLPPSETGHELVVVFSEPRLAPEPQVAQIHLPAVGPSMSCRFYLRTLTTNEPVEARVIILFANRVLQTLLFRAGIGDYAEPLELAVEASVRLDFGDLDDRTRFDVAIVLNQTVAGTPSATVVAGGSADLQFPVGLSAGASVMRAKLTEFATSPQAIAGLRDDRMRELLVYLAAHGSLLYESLIAGNVTDKLKEAKRIQIVTARPEEHVPIELLYAKPAPDPQAQLCGGAEQALLDGKCPSSCSPLATAPSDVVCPLGFWCLDRVLERHAHAPGGGPIKDIRLTSASEPSPRRDLLPLAGALFAASDRVDKGVPGSAKKVLDALGTTVPPATSAMTWSEWRDNIKARPGTLVLLPHTFEDDTFNVPGLEIAKSEHLLLTALDVQHVRPDESQPGPLVLLLGCETGAQSIEYQSFVVRLRTRGASIVVSTVASVLGRHAATTAVALLNELQKHRTARDTSFGDVMLAIRRQLLRDGVPMVLALSSYGDADWRLH